MQLYEKLSYRFLDGKTCLDEEVMLYEFISASPENRKLFLRWEESWRSEYCPSKSTIAGYRKLLARIAKNNPEIAAPAIRSRNGFMLWTQRIAVMLFPVMLATTLYFRHQYIQPVEFVTFYVPCGQTGELTLSDNTLLYVNADSKVIYPKKFSRPVRQIFVDGEVYAEIAEDPAHPFVMSVQDVNIRVLGTKFNVRSYPDDRVLEVALVEGSVELSSPKMESNVMLRPGEMLKFDKRSAAVWKMDFVVEEYNPSLVAGGLVFTDRRLAEIISQLERTFDRQIVIEDPRLAEKRFDSAFVNGETLDEILKYFSVVGQMEIRSHNDIYYISSK